MLGGEILEKVRFEGGDLVLPKERRVGATPEVP